MANERDREIKKKVGGGGRASQAKENETRDAAKPSCRPRRRSISLLN